MTLNKFVSIELRADPLTREAFAPFGDVIQTEGAQSFPINQGTTERYHDLANVQVSPQQAGRAIINIFRGTPRELPLEIRVMEKHPLGSQAFVPLSNLPYLIVVARPSATLDVKNIVAFAAGPQQGINYAAGVWHHPLIAMYGMSDFLVVDRGGEGNNLIEIEIPAGEIALFT